MKNISPHVNIYKFPITAISSIMNRVTGLGITGIYVASGTMLLFNKNPVTYYEKLTFYPKTVLNYGVISLNISKSFIILHYKFISSPFHWQTSCKSIEQIYQFDSPDL